jgi:hypothetical protein
MTSTAVDLIPFPHGSFSALRRENLADSYPPSNAAQFPQLGLGDVYAAMAYYHDNQEAIDRQIQESQGFVSRMRAQLSKSSNGNDEGTDANGNQVSS